MTPSTTARPSFSRKPAETRVHVMIGLGVVLIVFGLLLPSLVPSFAFAHLLFVLGVILLIVGAVLAVLGRTGHAVGGRRHYY
jgi:uncharacterized membrane protein HdeD (DUF308 family)